VITRFFFPFRDGRKQIVLTGVNFVDVFSAFDGRRFPGFPFTFGWTSIIADPVLYDIDEDGFDEILVSSMSGEMIFLNRWGEIVPGRTFKIPKLRVPLRWYSGLESTGTTTYMSLADAQESDDFSGLKKEQFVGRKVAPSKMYEDIVHAATKDEAERKSYKGTTSKVNPNKKMDDKRAPSIDATRSSSTGKHVWKGFEGWLTDEGLDSLQLFLASRPLSETEELDALFSPQYAHWIQAHPEHHQFPYSNEVFVDAHIYEAPVFADLDGDGSMELIVAVNYYFDDSITSKPGRVAKYPTNTDFSKYIACGVVAFSMKKEQIIWISPLELTTDASAYMARIYASPTIVDLDNDGKLDIIVGTSVGSVYVLRGDGTWNPRLGAVNTDSIGSGIVAADITGDGKMNLLLADDGGTLICFEPNGAEVWETRLSSPVNHAPILGDIDGDGALDVVVVASIGHVWAFSGKTGKTLQNFPIKLGSMVTSAPVLLPIPPFGSKRPWTSFLDGLAIIVHGADGTIYNIHAKTGCVQKIDLGESSMGMILADDLTANGFIDLLVTTQEGHVYCLSTGAPLAYTSSAWRSRLAGRNAFATGVWQGVRLIEDTKRRHHVSGNQFTFSFEIIDERPARGPNARYQVSLWHGARKWHSHALFHKGTHSLTIPAPPDIISATLKLEVTNEHGQAFFDTWNVGFNQSWYRTLKWLLALPVVFMSLSLLFMKDMIHFLP